MKTKNYEAYIQVNASPERALDAVHNVSGWWAKHLEGNTQNLLDRFIVRFGTTMVDFEITELVPGKKVVWEVKDSFLPWLKDKTEWTGTKVVWEITPAGKGAQLHMTMSALLRRWNVMRNARKAGTATLKAAYKT